MNTNRLLIGLVIALVIAFLLSSFVYKQFEKASIVKPTSTQNLVVAAVPLPLGTRLDASNVRLIQWPANQQVAGMFTRVLVSSIGSMSMAMPGPSASRRALSAAMP